ncbi:MAG: hypothetical protein A2176_05915 [Spirochaetes bacterium RBG_13_51_14]|nr:MAG: hypothetical protein A2176_05915 [Spirochaetes bacterium RBG_13_51_14]
MEFLTAPYTAPLLIALTLVFAVREIATYRGQLRLKYLFTPMVTALIAGFAILSIIESGPTPYRVLILAALILSLIADTMLMVVEVNLMQHGIIYFMLAHVMYSIAFSLGYSYRSWNLIAAGVLLLIFALFYRRIRGSVGDFRIPLLVYAVLLGAMLFFSLSSLNRMASCTAALIITGGVMFVISDFLLAYLTFVKQHKRQSVIVWAFYAPAQLMLALSCFG